MSNDNRTLNFVFAWLILGVSFFGAASVNAQKNGANGENVLISNKDHFISYKIDGTNVIFTMESVGDFKNDFNSEFPDTDFFAIEVDVDRNQKIDKDIDTSYSIRSSWKRTSPVDPVYRFIFRKKPICTVYLLGNGRSSTCGRFKSAASLKRRFEGSKNQVKAHPIFIFTIPKTELNKGGQQADLVFTIFASGRGYKTYPVTSGIDHQKVFNSFQETITIDW
jgi:hypothetical protein